MNIFKEASSSCWYHSLTDSSRPPHEKVKGTVVALYHAELTFATFSNPSSGYDCWNCSSCAWICWTRQALLAAGIHRWPIPCGHNRNRRYRTRLVPERRTNKQLQLCYTPVVDRKIGKDTRVMQELCVEMFAETSSSGYRWWVLCRITTTKGTVFALYCAELTIATVSTVDRLGKDARRVVYGKMINRTSSARFRRPILVSNNSQKVQ